MSGDAAAGTSVSPRLALAFDTDDLVEALRVARRMTPWFGVAKVGLELFSASGPEAVTSLSALGYRVFVDLKLHDIPTTVHKAARVIGALGAGYVTMHTSGGVAMLAAGVEGLADGAEAAGHEAPMALGVTVLTSHADAPVSLLAERVGIAAAAGCGGVVCAAGDLAVVRAAGAGIYTVVPGIRPAGAGRDDQQRSSTPADAIAAGADLLVIGRAVSAAADPLAAAAAVADEVAAAIGRQTSP
jgi:orotidine-5'-phosphate decarboxylase